MAKITDRQKVNMIAKWNTGIYTKRQLGKAYKISAVMVGKIVGKEEPQNADYVEAGVYLEKSKKLVKSFAEIAAINQAVKHRLEVEFNEDNNRIKIFDITGKVLDGVKELLANGKAQKVTTASVGDGIIESNIVEYDLQTEHYKQAMETVDKASITLGVNQRHAPKSDVNVNTQQNEQKTIIVQYD